MKRIQFEALRWIRDCTVEQACGSPPFGDPTLAALLRRGLVLLEQHHTGTKCWALSSGGRAVLQHREALGGSRVKTYRTGPPSPYEVARRRLVPAARHRRR